HEAAAPPRRAPFDLGGAEAPAYGKLRVLQRNVPLPGSPRRCNRIRAVGPPLVQPSSQPLRAATVEEECPVHKAVISGTGLYTPANSISNDELVASFNAYVQKYNADNAAATGRGELEPLNETSSAFIE